MQELRTYIRAEFFDFRKLNDLARAIIALLFYFELESIPKYGNKKILYAGNILYRLRIGNPALEALFDQLFKGSAQFCLGENTILSAVKDRSSINRNGNFRKRVEFSIYNRQYKIFIFLKEGLYSPNNISGSPFSIDSLVGI